MVRFSSDEVPNAAEKRTLAADGSDESDAEPKKKRRTLDPANAPLESILDDIRIDDINTNIAVHVIDTPEACTHEVAVYPGKLCDGGARN